MEHHRDLLAVLVVSYSLFLWLCIILFVFVAVFLSSPIPICSSVMLCKVDFTVVQVQYML